MEQQKILLIAPVFFNYYKDILTELRALGYEADYLCDTYSNSSLSKAAGRISKKLIRGAMEQAFRKKILPRLEKKQYHTVLVVAGMTFAFSPDMVGRMKETQTGARFVLYQWDSRENLPYIEKIHPYFDRIFTFDPKDARENPECTLLPLFYNRRYEAVGREKHAGTWKYDCTYVGTAHPRKYRQINEMAAALRPCLPRQFIYHYMPSRLKYVYHKLTAREYRKARFQEFQREKIPGEELAELFGESRCILDAPQDGQRGLTIRTLECLGAKRKLITTNPEVRNYDFFRESNIYVYDGEPDPDNVFFTGDYEELPPSVYRKYSLRSWIGFVLEEPKSGGKC